MTTEDHVQHGIAPHASHGSIFRETSVRTLAGFFFATLVGFFLIGASFLNAPFTKKLEIWNIDAVLRAMASGGAAPEGFFRTDTPFVLIDIDRRACADFVGEARAEEECVSPASPPPDLLAELVRGVDRVGAELLILDYPLPKPADAGNAQRQAATEGFLSLLKKPNGVPVIAPAPLYQTAIPASVEARGESADLQDGKEGRLRTASCIVWDDHYLADTTVRGYPTMVEAQRFSGSSPVLTYLPSAPFLAALYAKGDQGRRVADALFFSPSVDCDAKEAGQLAPIMRNAPFLAEVCTGGPMPDPSAFLKRLTFSMYSLSPSSSSDISSVGPSLSERVSAYYGAGTVEGGMLYRRFSVADFTAGPKGLDRFFNEIDLKGQIVVIGTTERASGDWHATPLGTMSGAEVIINATRAFLDFEPIKSKGKSEKVAEKAWQIAFATALGSVCIFIVLALQRLLEPFRNSQLKMRKWFFTAAYAVLPAFALVALMFVVAEVNVRFSLRLLAGGFAVASVSLLVPVLSILGETIIEILHDLLDWFHRIASNIVGFVVRRYQARRNPRES